MPWTIDELVAECGRVLADEPQPSGRVTDAPDLRTIRYYAALGLLDPPRAFLKKKALYDERHLLQLVAIKRLQRSGLALTEVQQQLSGASEAKLRSLARASARASAQAAPAPAPAPADAARFWARKPRVPPPVQALRVAPGITLLIDDAPRELTAEDATALHHWLVERGLATGGPK